MPQIEYDPKVSLGSILTAIPLVLALGAGWTSMNSRVSVVEAHQEALTQSLTTMAENIKDTEQRARENGQLVQSAMGRIEDRLYAIMSQQEHQKK